MTTILREYAPERDRLAARRIWREVGWLSKSEHEAHVDRYFGAGRALVAELDGEAECLVLTAPGEIRFMDEDLPLSCCTGVTTSRIARKQGLAGKLLALALAADADAGMLVAGLGAFEQGFYNRLGFGTGTYERNFSFDPAHLSIRGRHRVPCRLTAANAAELHEARIHRRRIHGGANVLPLSIMETEIACDENGFGLGYRDDGGELTHCFWANHGDREDGPYRILWLAFRTGQQFLELISLLQSLGDQVASVRMNEPPGIQLQDLIRQPFRARAVTEKSRHEARCHANAYMQLRMLDLAGCLARTHLTGEPVRFNLQLADPVSAYVGEESGWRGIGGPYVVSLGPESSAEPGESVRLPTLSASVGAFTRLWLGVQPASGLAVTDELTGPQDLLDALDRLLRLPPPKLDWDF